MTTLYWDCFSGIAGNMALASLIDLGASIDKVEKALDSMDFEEGKIELICKEEMTEGIRGIYVNTASDHHHDHEHTHDQHYNHEQSHSHNNSHGHNHGPHRGLKEITCLIKKSCMTENAKKIALNCFEALADSEAKIHGKSVDEVHFHEVGAQDSIADIVGVAVCLDELKVDNIHVSKISLGSGMVKCAHGKIPVPAPATALLLKNYQVQVNEETPFELTTPTGAAIICGLSAKKGMPDGFQYSKVGHGLGSKKIGRPNFLRAFLSDEVKKKS